VPIAKDLFFIPFNVSIDSYTLPGKFAFMFDNKPHPLCLLAAKELQEYLKTQSAWDHNFGLEQGEAGAIIGKMFGVLLVKTRENEIGYLAAFSGKLGGGNQHAKFVPPIFDGLTDTGFVNSGMTELTRMNQEIKKLETLELQEHKEEINLLKTKRRDYSNSLQNKIFDQYHFLNQAGEKKSLQEIFKKASYKNPPSGAGECAAPKLIQYAFQHKMKPLAIAEFWWGLSPKSATWKHGRFYPCCREKCEPILAHMLAGIEDEIK
jgi:tRNA pseudouridine32 synthase/23S rRNA pseudouridine746 synthase